MPPVGFETKISAGEQPCRSPAEILGSNQVSEIIDCVLEVGLYNYWISGLMHSFKLGSHKIAIVHQFDEYYSFNLYHMQPAFSLLLLGWFLSAICFMFEVLYNRVLGKWFEVFSGWLATLFFIMAGLHSST